MKRSAIETLLGAFVLAVAGFFLVFSYQTANVGSGSGYLLSADFASIGGLKAGDDVVVSGVKVGTVTSVDLVPDSYLARVTMEVDQNLKFPTDTAALISSESLLGGRYLALEPGADEEMIAEGGHIQYTQAPQNLEQLLGQFIFSMKDGKDKKEGEQSASSAPAPITMTTEPAPVEAVPVSQKAEETTPQAPQEEAPAEEPAHP